MLEKLVEGMAQGGPLAIIAFYVLYQIKGELSKLRQEVHNLHTKIAVLLDREIGRGRPTMPTKT